MNAIRIAAAILIMIAVYSPSARGQSEAAVPFLLVSPSSEANGMGGTTIAMERFDPTSSVFSPAQVGLAALTTNFRFGLSPSTSKTLMATIVPDLKYSAWATSAGVLLNDFVEIPLRIGVGVGFHRVENDLGKFTITSSSGPTPIGSFESTESASGFVVGVGVEYLVRFGFGYTFRSVESKLSPVGTEQEQGTGTANGNTHDYSFLLEAPLVSIVNSLSQQDLCIGENLQPFFDLNAGIGWNNVGDEIVYVDPAQADPFPRTARVGIAVQGGVCLNDGPVWEMMSLAWSREAEDLLVLRNSSGWEYQSGLGDIQFGTNVIEGKLTGNAGLRCGWQIQAAEVFTYRAGIGKGTTSYETSGMTIRLTGLLKGISRLAGSNSPAWLLFARDHVDLQYHHVSTTMQAPVSTDISSSAITLVYRVMPW